MKKINEKIKKALSVRLILTRDIAAGLNNIL